MNKNTKADQLEAMHQLVIDILLDRLKKMREDPDLFDEKWADKAMKFLATNGCHLEIADYSDITGLVAPSSTSSIPFPSSDGRPAKPN